MHATIFWQQTAIWTTAGKATKRHSRKGNVFINSTDGSRQKLPASGEWFVDGREGMGLEWESPEKKEVFAAAPSWPLAVPVYIRISLGAAPLFLSAKAPLEIRIYQTWPEVMPDSLKAAWKLRCRQYDAKGELLSNELVSTEYHSELDISLPLASSAHLLSWQPEIGGIPAAKAVELRIVRPGNFPENPAICGNQLLVSGRRAVLRCDPLQERTSGGGRKRTVSEVPMKLYYFDDGLGNTYNASKGASGVRQTTRSFLRMKGFSAGRILLPEIPRRAGIAEYCSFCQVAEYAPGNGGFESRGTGVERRTHTPGLVPAIAFLCTGMPGCRHRTDVADLSGNARHRTSSIATDCLADQGTRPDPRGARGVPVLDAHTR